VSGIDQLVVAASRRDAITTAALNAQEVLREVGPSHLLARHVHADLVGLVEPLWGDPPAFDDADPLILHGSIGDELVQHHALNRPGPVVLQYHNITPPRFFAGIDPAFAQHLAEGRHQLVRMRSSVAGAFADSAFNAADLEAMGYQDVRVVPLILRPERLRQIPPHEAAANHLKVVVTGPLILCVAQLLPHKRADLVLQAYNLLVTHHLPEAHLIIVGAQRSPRYSDRIRVMAEDLRLPRCWLAGEVDDDVLAAMYARADVLVVASEHEGLCVPLLEAMAFDMPIVARANAAIPETLGGAGLLVEGDAGPGLLAEALLAVLTDNRLSAELGRRSGARRAAFDPADASASLLANLATVL
jgi:glycosyltransferase involved in cell wall biosynthesis